MLCRMRRILPIVIRNFSKIDIKLDTQLVKGIPSIEEKKEDISQPSNKLEQCNLPVVFDPLNKKKENANNSNANTNKTTRPIPWKMVVEMVKEYVKMNKKEVIIYAIAIAIYAIYRILSKSKKPLKLYKLIDMILCLLITP